MLNEHTSENSVLRDLLMSSLAETFGPTVMLRDDGNSGAAKVKEVHTICRGRPRLGTNPSGTSWPPLVQGKRELEQLR